MAAVTQGYEGELLPELPDSQLSFDRLTDDL